jgi:hypothetical protein
MDTIQKAHQEGDPHPNGKWFWTKLPSGKFDWRPAKKVAPAAVATKAPTSSSKPTAAQITAAKAKSGKLNSQQLIAWAQKTDESNLIKVANNTTNKSVLMRKIAYDELIARGIDVSSIDTSGGLSTLLKLTGGNSTPTSSVDDDDDSFDNPDDEITEKWYLDQNDARIKKDYNLKTKEGRIKYDQFVYKMKKKEPDYMNPVEVVQDLNEQYLEFLDNDEQRFMISAGGAGVGKSYGFNKMGELLNKQVYGEGMAPGDGDYDIFDAPDVNSGKQLLQILKAHNGKIIVFDDNDKAIRRSDCASVMKKACSTTGIRIVGDPDDIKSNFEFTGRIMVMTNKDLNTLSENEDTKAIISRAMMKSEIYMTVPETIEVMKARFQDYEFTQAPRLDDEGDDKAERQEILDLIIKNQKNIDPAQFTTRVFQEILIDKRKVEKANEKRKNPAFASLIGGKMKDWREKALATLTKAEDDEFQSGSGSELIEKAKSTQLEKAEDLLFGEKLEPLMDFSKAFSSDFDLSEMPLNKAEDLLFAK